MTMAVNDYTRVVGAREYVLSGYETWIDVHELTVHISKGKGGIEVAVYRREDDGYTPPISSMRVQYQRCDVKTPLVLDLDNKPARRTVIQEGDGSFQRRLDRDVCPKCKTSLQKTQKKTLKCVACKLEINTDGNAS
jgi:hypothetical protein